MGVVLRWTLGVCLSLCHLFSLSREKRLTLIIKTHNLCPRPLHASQSLGWCHLSDREWPAFKDSECMLFLCGTRDQSRIMAKDSYRRCFCILKFIFLHCTKRDRRNRNKLNLRKHLPLCHSESFCWSLAKDLRKRPTRTTPFLLTVPSPQSGS